MQSISYIDRIRPHNIITPTQSLYLLIARIKRRNNNCSFYKIFFISFHVTDIDFWFFVTYSVRIFILCCVFVVCWPLINREMASVQKCGFQHNLINFLNKYPCHQLNLFLIISFCLIKNIEIRWFVFFIQPTTSMKILLGRD